MAYNNINDYVIITPAYNESSYIEITIKSVLAQSILPVRWVIVDDGSTDDTANIVRHYAEEYEWIEYLYRSKDASQSYYSSNVYAIMAGYEQVKHLGFDFLAILDADISLPTDYYESIFNRFIRYDKLGVASGVYNNLIDGKLIKVLNDRRSTPKAIQVFRRECFNNIGGYLPLKYGGEDACTCIMARMKGWKSWSFPEIEVIHNRPTGTGNTKNLLHTKLVLGFYEYSIGSHPIFVFLKSLRRCIKEKPYILGGLARIIGYSWKLLKRETRQIPDEVIKYVQSEQLDRVFNFNKIAEKDNIEVI